MLRTILVWLATGAAGLLALKLLVVVLEPRMAFFPFAGESMTPRQAGIPHSEVRLETSDGETLIAWQLEHESPAATVVYFHGNGGNLSIWLDVLEGIYRQGFDVFALDYRGYGRSTGRPSETGLYRDSDAVVAYVRNRLRPGGGPIVYWGRSLGGTFAAYAASVEPPDGLILESSFPDTSSLLRHYPLLRALAVFSGYRFPTAAFLEDVRRPVLVMHGARDRIVPYEEGRRLFDRLSEPKRFVTIADADHNDLFASDHPSYWPPVRDFIGELKAAGAAARRARSY